MEALYIGLFLSGIIGLALLIIYLNKKRKIAYNNEVVPYKMGNKTMYLRRSEIPHFEQLGRAERRKVVNRFDAKLKRGELIAVYEKGKIIGYTKNI